MTRLMHSDECIHLPWLRSALTQQIDECARLKRLYSALTRQLDRQITRSAALCAWAELLCDEADELRLETVLQNYRARIQCRPPPDHA